MRRALASMAAVALLLSSVGSAVAADPAPAPSTAPIVEPDGTPIPSPTTDPGPSSQPGADPTPSADPSPSAPVELPSPDASTAPAAPDASGSQPAADPHVRPFKPTPDGVADPTDRWIVVLKSGTDAVATAAKQGTKQGFRSDRTFRNAIRGYAAHLERSQVTALSHDPSVAMIVKDEKIEMTQAIPTGVMRINDRVNPIAKINGIDERVDADVAIVDTGIARVADLNVVGGYNCSTSDRTAWRDVEGHGTHVAGTVGAIDNGTGVVGVAPGVRLWAVKILNDSGAGLLSWYVCGLDWIAAQRDPNDSSRPLIEAVNMSVAKTGRDDVHCGTTNADILHQAICRLVASGVTVVAAAGNDHASASNRVPAAYNEVITVSALADTDGIPGGTGGHRCSSWGGYDVDDTFADFSNYGSDIDLIAPGKCIMSTIPGGLYKYMSGTSMAAPHVTGAVALLKASRPYLTPAEVREALMTLGSTNWRSSTDPDHTHERLLDVSRIGPRGDFGVSVGAPAVVGGNGGTARFAITLSRSATLFERIRLSIANAPSGFGGTFDVPAPFGFAGVASTLTVTVPAGLSAGTYNVTVVGDEHGNQHTATAHVVVETDTPTAQPPSTGVRTGAAISSSSVPTSTGWGAATDATSAIGAYELQRSVDGGAWTTVATTSAGIRSAAGTQTLNHSYRYRVRARDAVGNWGAYASGATLTSALLEERASAVTYSGTWHKYVYSGASGGSTTYTTSASARVRTTFSGRGIAVVGPMNSTRGSAAVYVDGVYKGTISFRASSGMSRMVRFATLFPTLGTHTIELRPTGNGRVDLDAFVILR
jgi:subtilisin